MVNLKNASATFHLLINKMFKDNIIRTMKVYIEDMVVKSKNTTDHIWDLAETFDKLRV